MSKKQKQLLERTEDALRNIVEGGDETLKAIYREYRGECLRWAERSFNVPEHEAIDIFQDTVIVFYKNVLKGKITELQSSIKTYLFAICKNKFMNYYSKKSKLVLVEDVNDPLLKDIDWTLEHTAELTPRKELIKESLGKLTDICLKIINMVYYKRFSMEAVKEHMGYSSEEVARTTKRKCMRKLEIIIREKLGK